tara:strand:+ start:730 stop:1194 length:465 start_codon:yes stop_codon:yes gene_type:complete
MVNHLDKKNNPIIVDISNKRKNIRIAQAVGEIKFKKEIFKKIEKFKSKKGSINNVAILAGIMGAKETSRLIPLCHNIPISSININIIKNASKNSLIVEATVKTKSNTGVEMEALTAVSISCLTIYDMCKYLSKSIEIKNIKLISKIGGKSDYLE